MEYGNVNVKISITVFFNLWFATHIWVAKLL
jgi:hypothetical protein